MDGFIIQLAANDLSLSIWNIHNSMVMFWLIHSVEVNIAEIYLLYPITKAFWDVVTLTYSNFVDSSQMFDLQNRAHSLPRA